MKSVVISTVVAALALVPRVAAGQDAENLRAAIEGHYTAIHAADVEATSSHHLPEITIFPGDGHALMEVGWEETTARMGTAPSWPDGQVTMKHFSSQIYGEVGIAMFYLDGTHGGEPGTWRVSAVWVWRGGEWKEAHHHESRLIS